MLQVVARSVSGAVESTERGALDFVRAQRAILVEFRLSHGDAALFTETISLTYRHPSNAALNTSCQSFIGIKAYFSRSKA